MGGTQARSLIESDSGPQAVGFNARQGTALLAGALLRFQRLGAREVCGEAALHPSQPGVPGTRTLCAGVEAGQARPRYQARGVDLVKLSPLSNGYARYRGDRIGMDCLQQGPGTARVDARQAARFPFPGPQKLGILRLRSGRAPST